MFIEMVASSSTSLNAQVIEKELKNTSANDADCVFSVRKNHVGLNIALWNKFGIVQQHGKDCGYASCLSCKKVYTFKKTTGTSTMGDHKCPKVERSGSGAMNLFATKGVPTAHDKKTMTLAAANFCAIDLRPFESIAGHGLKGLVQTALNIGVASSKRIMVDDLLCNPSTARRNIESRAMAGRAIVAKRLQEHIATDVSMASTLDLWTDSIKKVAYISVTAHYIDEEFTLFDRTLHVKPVRDESHTAVMVLDEFKEALDIFGIKDLVFDRITVVADCGSNIVAEDGISSEFDLLGCIDHKISNCLTYVLNKTTKQVDGKKSKPFYRYLDEPNMAALYTLIDACKSLVAYFKKSNLQSRLSKTLKQENATRWNSLYHCLLSVSEMLIEVIDLLKQKDALRKVASISETCLKHLIDLLAPFQKATLDLEQFKEPTLHKVVFWRFQLLKHLQVVMNDVINDDGTVRMSKDSPSIIACKYLLTPLVQEKMELNVLHVVATLLDPVMKNHMRKMEVPEALVTKAKAKLRELMHSIGTGEVLANLDHEKNDAPAPPQKKRRNDDRMSSMYDEFEDEDELEELQDNGVGNVVVNNLDARIDIEFNMYEAYKVNDLEKNEIIAAVSLALPMNRDSTAKFNILLWWKLKGAPTFPIMSRVARSVLCIPASSSKSESNFSDAGNMITKNRSRLKPSIVNDLLFVRSNQDLV